MSFHITTPQINEYAERMTTPESEVLAQLNRQTNLKVALPIMLSGHLQGSVLKMISQMVKPKMILEIGTYTGYSAICLADGLQENGILHTIDVNAELEDFCRSFWESANLASKVIAHIGEASRIIPEIKEMFDLVFIDADKTNYCRYFDLVIEKVKPGGWIIADNVLYDAEVVLPYTEQSKNARAIDEYNKKVFADERVEQVLLPVRDGLNIARKR